MSMYIKCMVKHIGYLVLFDFFFPTMCLQVRIKKIQDVLQSV